MRHNSIQRRLIATVVLSHCLLTAGLVLTGVFYTYWRVRSSLDTGMQAQAMSVAALVRYNEDASGNVYFDDSLLPSSIDPNHPDLFEVWTERSGLLVRSAHWPTGLQISPRAGDHWNFNWDGTPYRALRLPHVPVLDREEGKTFQPQTLTILYAAPTIHLRQQVKTAGIFITAVSLFLLAVSGVLALRGIRRGLWPLEHLAREAALVSAQNWELRLPAQLEEVEELRPLTRSMTGMLERLRHSFEQQREFLGSAAHELKTPVAVLKSTLQSLLQRPRDREEYRVGLEHSLEDLERLEQLMQWMLRLARAEQWAHGALRRDLEIIDVNATCEAAVDRVRNLAAASNTAVRLTRDGPVPLRADPEDLHLVWTNLLENAVRFSPEGATIEIMVARRNRDLAQITVTDQGAGIPPEDLPHVFERFYRGDPSRSRSTGGYGLGLAIAKALIEAYGGQISAESTPGKGTRMIVELPLTSSN